MPSVPSSSPQSGYLPLSWENTTEPHPERKAWSLALSTMLDGTIQTYLSAKDIELFCPKIKSLDKQKQIKAIAEMWVAIGYYESGYDPNSQSVDVGSKDDKDSWSIGLMQMSVTDQESYGIEMGLDFKKLLMPENNIKLALAIMKQQIQKYGVIAIPLGGKGLYWATIHPGGSYDETQNIIKRAKDKTGFCQ